MLSLIVTLFGITNGLVLPDGMNLIPTPHGLRPEKCVIRHDSSDVYITYDESGTTALYRDTGLTKFFPRDQDCVDNAIELFGNGALTDSGLQAWDVDASYTPPSKMGNFTSTYQIPNESPPCTGGSLLYWFIGFQNNDGSGTTGLTIAQPVVNYQYNKWVMEPWNCCPNGQSNTGKTISMAPGRSFPTWIYANSEETMIGMSWQSQSSQLTVKTAGRNWDWACVTLEEYSASCNNYPDQAFNFTDMKLVTMSGKELTANWRANRGSCQGGAKISSSSFVQIYGKDMP